MKILGPVHIFASNFHIKIYVFFLYRYINYKKKMNKVETRERNTMGC